MVVPGDYGIGKGRLFEPTTDISPQKICPDCLLEFSVTAVSEAEIRSGEAFVFYCPRCGSIGIGAVGA